MGRAGNSSRSSTDGESEVGFYHLRDTSLSLLLITKSTLPSTLLSTHLRDAKKSSAFCAAAGTHHYYTSTKHKKST